MKTTAFRREISLLLVLSMAFTLALGCTGCGGAGAASMFLRKTEGTVAVADAGGADVAPAENLGLYSGYTVGTKAESYAWIDLDKVKLAKLDENSAAEITKDGKNLSIEVTSGSLFFNVAEPLAEDETMEIRASSMIDGIRGTCGWVEIPENGILSLYLLEGRVECTAGENTATVNAGEMAEMTADGAITVLAFTAQEIPAFVMQELQAAEDAGPDAAGPPEPPAEGVLEPMTGYDALLEMINSTDETVVFAEEFDFEADGSPELLVITRGETNPVYNHGVLIQIYRDGPGGPALLVSGAPMGIEDMQYVSCSLAQREGKLYVQCWTEKGDDGGGREWYELYYGPLAGPDGGQTDWSMTDSISVYVPAEGSRTVWAAVHDERGAVNGDIEWTEDAQQQAALLSRYTVQQELYRVDF